ncbi:MAG: hypothetical protein H7Z41_01110, partial [Cytophagales bacterium]|nr:hypothetical protein [Armatimonadota bacterium]
MDRTRFFMLTLALSSLLVAAPVATAQTGGDAPVTPPASPSKPQDVPTDAQIKEIVSRAMKAKENAFKAMDASLYFNSQMFGGLPEKRQNVDLKDVPLREALKRVLEDSKIPYLLDDDVPNEPKVTIKLANAPLTTILDALTLSSNIGWRTELKRRKTAPEGEKGKSRDSGSGIPFADNGGFETQIHVGKQVSVLPSSFRMRTLNIDGPPGGSVQIPVPPVGPQSPQMRVFRWQSQKRTFTCPHCRNSISILQQPEDIHCLKCQRVFEEDWQVCPYDGAKRPERKDAWRY